MRYIKETLLIGFVLFSFQNVEAGWQKQSANTLAWLKTVYFVDANTGWIGGSKGTLLKTTDGGTTWKKVATASRDNLREIYFTDKNNGWILCERDVFSLGSNSASYLLKTTNGGKKWEQIEFKDNPRHRVTKIFFSLNGFGLAIGEMGILFGLEDDNRGWKKLSLPSRYLMSDGVFLDDLNSTIVGGGGTILFTEDAGLTWNQAQINERKVSKFNAVFFTTKKRGWAVGTDGSIFNTTNGGRFWRSQQARTKERLNDLYFINSKEGWAIGDNGTILHTQTGGDVWVAEDSRSNHRLESIHFKGNRGWVVGFGGTILRYDAIGRSKTQRPRFRKSL